jgi:hypothetical protein
MDRGPSTDASAKFETWRYKDIEIVFEERHDGGGRGLAPMFVQVLREKIDPPRHFRRALEWCAGPGFIGFALLAEGLCDELCLIDVNPELTESIERTLERNRLRDRVVFYLSDNLDRIPESERFDLVCANPPNYYCVNPRHPAYTFIKCDLRPNDADWAIHRLFYSQITRHLLEGALLCIQEIDPFATEVFLRPHPVGDSGTLLSNAPFVHPVPFDLRPRPPIIDFLEMIRDAGLTYLDTLPVTHDLIYPAHLMLSTWTSHPPPPAPLVALSPHAHQVFAGGAGRERILAFLARLADARSGQPMDLLAHELGVSLLELQETLIDPLERGGWLSVERNSHR